MSKINKNHSFFSFAQYKCLHSSILIPMDARYSKEFHLKAYGMTIGFLAKTTKGFQWLS